MWVVWCGLFGGVVVWVGLGCVGVVWVALGWVLWMWFVWWCLCSVCGCGGLVCSVLRVFACFVYVSRLLVVV